MNKKLINPYGVCCWLLAVASATISGLGGQFGLYIGAFALPIIGALIIAGVFSGDMQ